MTPTRRCVVCGSILRPGSERFANSWEASLGQRACCGDACAKSFDPDRHWMPSSAPTLLDPNADEHARLLGVAKHRLRTGDDATLVVRDLLLAGVEPWVVRNTLLGVGLTIERARKSAGELNASVGLFARIFGLNKTLVVGAPDRVEGAGGAYATIDAWSAHFGLSSASASASERPDG